MLPEQTLAHGAVCFVRLFFGDTSSGNASLANTEKVATIEFISAVFLS